MDFNKKRLWGPTPKYSGVLNYKRPNNDFIVVAGPCSVESKDQIYKLAGQVKASGATHLRGGVFRAGTYPGDNFGYVDMDLIKAHHHAAEKNGLKNIIEILDYTPESISAVIGGQRRAHVSRARIRYSCPSPPHDAER